MFDKYEGTVTLEVDGLELVVTPTNKQIAKFVALDQDKIKTEQGYVALTDTLEDIIASAYPQEKRSSIAVMVRDNASKIMEELVVKLGWMTKEELQRAADEAKGKLEAPGVKKPSA